MVSEGVGDGSGINAAVNGRADRLCLPINAVLVLMGRCLGRGRDRRSPSSPCVREGPVSSREN